MSARPKYKSPVRITNAEDIFCRPACIKPMLCAANLGKIALHNLSVRINNRYFPLPCYEFLTNRDLPVNLPVNLLVDLPVNLLADLLYGKHMKSILFEVKVTKK